MFTAVAVAARGSDVAAELRAEPCRPSPLQEDEDVSSEDEEIESSGDDDDDEGVDEEGAPMDADGAQVRRKRGSCRAAPDDG